MSKNAAKWVQERLNVNLWEGKPEEGWHTPGVEQMR